MRGYRIACAVQITDRTAGSMRPSEAARWNDRVSRLEAEIMEERERRWGSGQGKGHAWGVPRHVAGDTHGVEKRAPRSGIGRAHETPPTPMGMLSPAPGPRPA